MRSVASALIHYPVLDRSGGIVTSAITNIDLHDISRSSHSFGLSDFFVVHPVQAQRVLASRIQTHWVEGSGGRRIPDRVPALGTMRVVPSLDAAVEELAARSGAEVEIWTTAAREQERPLLRFAEARQRIAQDGPPVLICFGTGWGLGPEIHARATHQLEPIRSPRADGYNHLSVRAAVAIILDRVLGVA